MSQMTSSTYHGVSVKTWDFVRLYVCLILSAVIVSSEETEAFIRRLCTTSQELWEQNHNFLVCGQMLSEVRVRCLTDQIQSSWDRIGELERNHSSSHNTVIVGLVGFLIVCGSLLLMYKVLVGGQGNELGGRISPSEPSDEDKQDKKEEVKQHVDIDEQKVSSDPKNSIAASVSDLQRCMVCFAGNHVNLVACPMLKCMIPMNGRAEVIPWSLCVLCLSTSEQDG